MSTEAPPECTGGGFFYLSGRWRVLSGRWREASLD